MTPFGILIVNKPPGISSRDAVNRVERLTRPVRCGHAGTLDPLATGVLVVCVGQATRLVEYVQRMPKVYRATFLFGRSSPTDDVDGETSPIEGAPIPSRGDLQAVLPKFLGPIEQRPPAFSAVKVAGERAYKRARRGETVELDPRQVTIHRLNVRRYEYPELELDIECGSGTYVRSLGRDMAAALGTAAVMSALERTAIGGFRVEDAIQLDELTAESMPQHMRPALTAVVNLPRITLNEADGVEIHHGRPIRKPTCAAGPPREWSAIDSTGHLVGILFEKKPGQLWPICNFERQPSSDR